MGSRPACNIVQATNELAASFPHPGVKLFIYIDNFYLIGSNRQKVKIAAEKLIQRLTVGRILINGLSGDASPVEVEALLEACLDSTTIEVLGEVIDLLCCSVTLTASSQQKLDQVRSVLSHPIMPVRTACAIFGVLLYASSVLGLDAGEHWLALDAFRNASRYGASQQWAARCFGELTDDSVMATLAWLEAVSHAPPFNFLEAHLRAADEARRPVDCSLTIDASAYGVGVVASSAGRTTHHSIPWSPAERSVLAGVGFASTRTEPCAAVRAVLACAPPNARHIKIRSDHLGLVLASRASIVRCFSYNETFRRLRAARPGVRFTWEFLPGWSNIVADRLSRGLLAPDHADSVPPPPPFVRIGCPPPPCIRIGCLPLVRACG